MQETKGHCKHGEFDLREGCPQCIAERKEAEETGRAEHKPGSQEVAEDLSQSNSTTTAVVKVKPEADGAIIALHEQALKLEQYAVALIITNDDDVKASTNDLSIISGLKKAIEEKRKEYTQPINDHLKAVNEAFKAFIEPLLAADKITREKVLAYRAEQERKRLEAEDIARQEREVAERKAALTGEPVVVPEPVEAEAPPPDHYRADMGTLGKSVIWKFKVIDFSLLPDRYKMENATLIGKVVRAGEREIPGVKIWSEESLRVTTKKE